MNKGHFLSEIFRVSCFDSLCIYIYLLVLGPAFIILSPRFRVEMFWISFVYHPLFHEVTLNFLGNIADFDTQMCRLGRLDV